MNEERDDDYARAVECLREMLPVFLGLRARHPATSSALVRASQSVVLALGRASDLGPLERAAAVTRRGDRLLDILHRAWAEGLVDADAVTMGRRLCRVAGVFRAEDAA